MKKITIVIVLCLLANFVAAQTRVITGKVTDAKDGTSIPGVSVKVKGTNLGGVTDMDGKYEVKAPEAATHLIFTFIGMAPKEVKIGASNVINVSMSTSSEELDEVVVVAYGTAKKSSLTGSSTTIKTEKLNDVQSESVENAVNGKIAGVQVSSTSGMAGSSTSIRIRGVGSINASQAPLYVIDGIPVVSGDQSQWSTSSGIMSTINPSDIATITVLKDAASATLYGSRAANGVVLITTKKGEKGETKYKFKSSMGYTDFAVDNLPYVGGDDYVMLQKEGLTNHFLDQGKSKSEAITLAQAKVDELYSKPAGGYTDWKKELFRTGTNRNTEFSASGGNKKTKFFVSGSYLWAEGVAIANDFERYTGRLNLTHKEGKFEFALNTTMSYSIQNYVSGETAFLNPWYATNTFLVPTWGVKDKNGNYVDDPFGNKKPNLLKELPLYINDTKITRSFSSGHVQYEIIKGLIAKSSFGVDYFMTEELQNWPYNSSDGETHNGLSQKIIGRNWRLTSTNTVNYVKTLMEDHTIEAMLGYEIESNNYSYLYAASKNFPNTILPELTNGAEKIGASSNKTDDRMMSYLSRAKYNYKNKYYAEGSFRRDGSSRFGKDNRWGSFWSTSASWRITEESFMDNYKDYVSNSKLRVSYGVNGTRPTGLYGHMALYDYGNNYNETPGSAVYQIPNPKMKWEENYVTNIGFEATILDRVDVKIDWYNRDTKNLLLKMPVSRTTGFASTWKNVGEMNNRGIEFEVHSKNIEMDDFKWETSIVAAYNKNEVTDLYDGEEDIDFPYIMKEGYSINTFYQREWAGVNPSNGKALWYKNTKDENGNVISGREVTEDKDEAQYVIVGNSDPDLWGSITNDLTYKGFNLMFQFNYQIGGKTYFHNSYTNESDGNVIDAPILKTQLNRWQKPGDVAENPRRVWGDNNGSNYNSTRRIHDADYLRLKNVVLSYSFPGAWLKRAKLSRLRLFTSASNLLTFAKHDLYDPEVNIKGSTSNFIPPIKAYTFGIEIEF